MRVGFLHSLIRKEEKLLIDEFKRHDGVELVMLDDRKLIFELRSKPNVDVVIERCINHSRALHGLKLLEAAGIRCINTAEVANICGDKILTSLALQQAGADPRRIASTHIEALLSLVDGPGAKQLHLPSRIVARRLRSSRILLRRLSS